MTEREIIDFIYQQARNYSPRSLSDRSSLSIGGIAEFCSNNKLVSRGAELRTIVELAEAMGYELVLIHKVGFTVKPDAKKEYHQLVNVRSPLARPLLRISGSMKEAECLKCGLDVGVVEVAGHLQCANCGHIVEDCCGG